MEFGIKRHVLATNSNVGVTFAVQIKIGRCDRCLEESLVMSIECC